MVNVPRPHYRALNCRHVLCSSLLAADRTSDLSDSPHVLDAPPILSPQDLQDLPSLRIFDLREVPSRPTPHCQSISSNPLEKVAPSKAEATSPIPGLPEGAVVVHMPFSTVRGHTKYCASIKDIQMQMRPPPPVRGISGSFHVAVYSDSHVQAIRVARMLALSHTPFVGVYKPGNIGMRSEVDFIRLNSK
jgi:hypothetical protein